MGDNRTMNGNLMDNSPVYIVYNKVDAIHALDLNLCLMASRIPTWIDYEQLKSYKKLEQERYTAIMNASSIILLISQDGINSGFSDFELDAIEEKQMKSDRLPHDLLFIKIDDDVDMKTVDIGTNLCVDVDVENWEGIYEIIEALEINRNEYPHEPLGERYDPPSSSNKAIKDVTDGILFLEDEVDISWDETLQLLSVFFSKTIHYDIREIEFYPKINRVAVCLVNGKKLDLGVKIKDKMTHGFLQAKQINFTQTKNQSVLRSMTFPIKTIGSCNKKQRKVSPPAESVRKFNSMRIWINRLK